MNEETKQKAKKALKGVGLALGLLACFLLGLGAGYSSAQSGEPTTALTRTTPKRAYSGDGFHEVPYISIPKNVTAYTLVKPTLQSDYIEAEGGYWLSASYVFELPEGQTEEYAPNAYSLAGEITTNESDIVKITDTEFRINVSVNALGPVVLLPKGYSWAFINETHYYQVPTLLKDINSNSLENVYPKESYALFSTIDAINAYQLYTNIEPYSVYYPTQSTWQDRTDTYTGSTHTFNNLNTYLAKQKDLTSANFDCYLKNRTLNTIHVSLSKDNAMPLSSTIYDIEVEPNEEITIQRNSYVALEATTNFILSREGLEQEYPSPEFTQYGTYKTKLEINSGDYPVWVVGYGTDTGLSALTGTFQLFSLTFQALTNILTFKVMGFSLGFLLSIPLIITLIVLIFRAVKK